MNHPTSIAVVGMAGTLPGAKTLDQYWRNIVKKADTTQDVPPDRWVVPPGSVLAAENIVDKAYHHRACLLDRIEFDPTGLQIEPPLARQLDPLHHLVLNTGRDAFVDAGPHAINKDNTGVVLAAIALPSDGASAAAGRTLGRAFEARLYQQATKEKLTPKIEPLSRPQALAARVTSYPAELLAAGLGLGGSAFTLDAACASSLYAVKLACDALTHHRADAMLAGGVSRPDCLYTQIGFSQLRALSRSGRCAPFSPRADGLVVGEGAGILVLKRLSDAVRDQNHIYGIITAIGLSNDLRGNLLAPDSEGQLRAMRAAYEGSGWTPADVDLIECHGAGTPLGDRSELESLVRLWQGDDWRPMQTVLGSVKSMIGHLLTAAAAASMIKVLLAIKHRTLPPTLNVDPDDTVRPLSDTPFRLLSQPEPWIPRADDTPLRTAVNAFGFGGINAHLLVEEYLPQRPIDGSHRSSGERPIDLSAKRRTADRIAVVGVGSAFGPLPDRESLQEAIAENRCVLGDRPPYRWRGAETVAADVGLDADAKGGYLNTFYIDPAKFRIPPNELGDIVAQHLLMLNVAWDALADADMTDGSDRVDTGVVIGMEFDFEATDFHLRWDLENRIEPWISDLELALSAADRDRWLAELRTAMGPPLNHARTLGALGSMVASRLTRAFRLGGPSFVVSETQCSGLRAVEIGVRALQQHEVDSMLVGAVDLAGDVRCTAIMTALGQTGHGGTAIGEGAAAFVLKREKDARRDGDRIYALIGGIGHAGDQGTDADADRRRYHRSLQQAATEAGIGLQDIDHYETGDIETERLLVQVEPKDPHSGSLPAPSIASLDPLLGRCGAAAAMASLTAAVLRLSTQPPRSLRHACVTAMSTGVSCSHLVLSAAQQAPGFKPSALAADGDRGSSQLSTKITVGGDPPQPPLPMLSAIVGTPSQSITAAPSVSESTVVDQELIRQTIDLIHTTAGAHQSFLKLSADMTRLYGETFKLQNELIAKLDPGAIQDPGQKPLFDRRLCLEFATGSAAAVLGPEFAAIDSYRARVRLPDEPLMLVDRILSIEGKKGGLGPGKIVTEHDVPPEAWYLDGGRAPVCISVEAGQADLFLSSYLGIDLVVKGRRTYRLLDATVEFHRGLPRPGDVIRYTIEIEKFVRQDKTHLFFFHFEGAIGDEHLITMTDGCAGFFSEQEVTQSGGILLTPGERAAAPDLATGLWEPWVPAAADSYSERQIDALRKGDLAAAFGPQFKGVTPSQNLWLPDGRMRLIHRVLHLDPDGGRYGNGIVRAQADIDPEDWFLTCHFVDDMVMPGTLMYECCAHTLRVLMQRMGWITDRTEARYEPVVGVRSKLKCRGPVTPNTRKVIYEVEVRHIGYDPQPYVIGDAHMYADDHRIVLFKDISLQLSGVSKNDLETFWRTHRDKTASDPGRHRHKQTFDRGKMISFAEGKPSEAFGDRYLPFDQDRFIARLPRPPYLFIDRVTHIEPEPWVLSPGGWIEACFETQPDHWYFKAERTGAMPFCVLLEIALQPCGWLAAYMGSALKSDRALKFRNLGGQARILADIPTGKHLIKTRTRLTKVSEVADMIIEDYEFEVFCDDRPVYTGTTYFGFFTASALDNQTGIRDAAKITWHPSADIHSAMISSLLEPTPPLFPQDRQTSTALGSAGLKMPSGALAMIDRAELLVAKGGRFDAGFARGELQVDPNAWYFKAHFYQDPVCPGSLGIESLIQLIKQYVIISWNNDLSNCCFSLVSGQTHQWSYRGQILPSNRKVELQASIKPITPSTDPIIVADGLLAVDGLVIYEMNNFGLKLSSKPPQAD